MMVRQVSSHTALRPSDSHCKQREVQSVGRDLPKDGYSRSDILVVDHAVLCPSSRLLLNQAQHPRPFRPYFVDHDSSQVEELPSCLAERRGQSLLLVETHLLLDIRLWEGSLHVAGSYLSLCHKMEQNLGRLVMNIHLFHEELLESRFEHQMDIAA